MDENYKVVVVPYPQHRRWRISVQEKMQSKIPVIGEDSKYHSKWVEFAYMHVENPHWWNSLFGDTLANRKKWALDWAEVMMEKRKGSNAA